MDRIINTESQLEQFAAISDPNSISPQTVANLLSYLLERVDDAIDEIYGDGSTIQVFAYNGGEISELLDNLNGRINHNTTNISSNADDISEIYQKLAEAYKLPHIRVASKDDEILKNLQGGLYSVIVGSMPYLLVNQYINESSSRQYLFRLSIKDFVVYSRKYTGVWTAWQSEQFSSQEFSFEISHDANNNYFDLDDIPTKQEYGTFHIRVFNDDSGLTEFTGTLVTWYRPDESLQYYNIFAPTGIYSATAAQNANPTNWSFKQYMFSEDISALQQQVQTNTTNIATLQQLIGYTIEQLQTL